MVNEGSQGSQEVQEDSPDVCVLLIATVLQILSLGHNQLRMYSNGDIVL